MKCPECGKDVVKSDEKWIFCPCGRKMDGAAVRAALCRERMAAYVPVYADVNGSVRAHAEQRKARQEQEASNSSCRTSSIWGEKD